MRAIRVDEPVREGLEGVVGDSPVAVLVRESLLLALVLLAFDMQNLLAWWQKWRLRPDVRRSDDFTIVLPVYGHPRYFADREHIRHLQENVLVALEVSAGGMSAFADELEAEGWRVHRARIQVPGPPILILDAIKAGAVKTRYVLRMDADTRPLDDPGEFVAKMEDEAVDLASVRVLVAQPRKLVERMQAVEYRMAMLSRRYRPWLTSGACFAGTTEAVGKVLSSHSLWFPGEDLETGRIALAMKLKVRHLDLRVETDAPDSWHGLLKQRRSWWAGSFRHSVVNADKNIRHTPVWTIYYLGLVMFGLFMKTNHIIHPTSGYSLLRSMLLLFLFYAVITVIANWQARSYLMFCYPPYALLQVMAMASLGGYWWVRKAREQRHLGRYRFGYRRGDHNVGFGHAVGELPPREGTVGARLRRIRDGIVVAPREPVISHASLPGARRSPSGSGRTQLRRPASPRIETATAGTGLGSSRGRHDAYPVLVD